MKKTILYFLSAVLFLIQPGCSKKGADETTPVDQVKAEAAKMDVSKLRSMALSYKDTIVAKQADLAKVADQIKAINPAELLSQKATQLKTELANIEKSINALKERFTIYYEQLKAKGGELTGLELK